MFDVSKKLRSLLTFPELAFVFAPISASSMGCSSLSSVQGQYHDWIKLFEAVSRYRVYLEVSHLRPVLSVSEAPHLWWHYAARASLQQKKIWLDIVAFLVDAVSTMFCICYKPSKKDMSIYFQQFQLTLSFVTSAIGSHGIRFSIYVGFAGVTCNYMLVSCNSP